MNIRNNIRYSICNITKNTIKKTIIFLIFALLQNQLIYGKAIYKKDIDETKEIKNQFNSYYFKQFQEIFRHIENDYLQKADHQEMTDEAIDAMLKSLDPYSGYYTNDDLESLGEMTSGQFGGIGVEITYENGAVKIISPIDDLPAYNAGIKPGDYIVGINGKLVNHLGFNKAVKEMRGEPNTKLNLLVVKNLDNSVEEMELTRKIIKIKPVKFEIENDTLGNIAYLRLASFNKQSFIDLKKAINEIQDKSKKDNKELKGMILDLRNNSGGLLDQAVDIVQYFIKSGDIVSIQSRHKEKQILSASEFVDKAPMVPMIILINEGSASASEIVAGAMQDHKRAVILGTTSFGKGLIQTLMQVNKRAAVKLTTGKYYTPNGKSINGTGIIPDIYVEDKLDYANKKDKKNLKNKKRKIFTSKAVKSYLNKYNTKEELKKSEEKYNKESKTFNYSKRYKEDYQYSRAYDLLKSLIIVSDNSKTK